jgi:hypothetical protein
MQTIRRHANSDEIPEVIPVLEPADEEPLVEANEHSLLGLSELLLKSPARIDRLTRDDHRQAELIPRFLIVALASFTLFSLAFILLLDSVEPTGLPPLLAAHWSRSVQPAVSLWLAYTLGLVAASGVCLPSFYFYSLLAGVRITMLEVTTHVLKGKASTAIMLVGLLPIYVAVVLGLIVFKAQPESLQSVLTLGLALPFLAGLWGVWSIYRGFLRLADTLPVSCRDQRACFLRRLTVAWAAVYTAVTPIMIYTLWEKLAG